MSKEEFIEVYKCLLEVNKSIDSFKKFKNNVLYEEVYKESNEGNFLDFLKTTLTELNSLDLNAQWEFIQKNLEEFNIEHDEIELFSYYQKLKINEAKKINYINSKIVDREGLKTDTKNQDEKYKNEIVYKVGLLFASGGMEKYYEIKKGETIFKSGYSAPKVAKEVGHVDYEKCILATVNDYKKEMTGGNGNKNIFNSRFKMLEIIKDIEASGKEVIPYFIERLPIE